MLDRLCGCDGDDERLRVGEADVLGGEHDHAPGDEAWILAALEHRREVVDGCIGIRAAHRLDEGRDEVVVRVAAFVVDERSFPSGIFNMDRSEGLSLGHGRLGRELEDVERVAGVASSPAGDQLDDLVAARLRRSPLHRAAR